MTNTLNFYHRKPTMGAILLVESVQSFDRVLPSGSYWYRLEMAYGLYKLGYKVYVLQHPVTPDIPWVTPFYFGRTYNQHALNGERIVAIDEYSGEVYYEINPIPDDVELIITLRDIPIQRCSGAENIPLIYWDTEGLPNWASFYRKILDAPTSDSKPQYHGAWYPSYQSIASTYFHHLIHQNPKWVHPNLIFSVAQAPILQKAIHLPLGSEPDLYKYRSLMDRDIQVAIMASSSRWFMAEDRIEIVTDILKQLGNPVTYWYGTYPESDSEKLPLNCYPTGRIDFHSLRFILQRINYLIHVPRPFHVQTNTISATVFQANAAGATCIHNLPSESLMNLGKHISTVHIDEVPSVETYPKQHTYQQRFLEMISQIKKVI